MSVARVTEITATSPKSFEDAVQKGLTRAGKTLHNIKGAWIKEQSIDLDDGKIRNFRVDMKVTFVLDD
jgi:flavin-binding protein dodecin